MTIFKLEMRRGKLSTMIWTAAVSFMLAISCLIFPEISVQMDEVNNAFANMGAFTEAFGMDQLNFGEFIGYFGVECGNVLGIGGALFAALTGISALAKEEKERTAEFLLTAPISRARVVLEKLCAAACMVVIFNLVIAACTVISILIIGEKAPAGTMALLFLANLFMHLEIACVTFGISACLKRGGLGIGIGLAALFYFLNIIANIEKKTEFLKYITPFGFCESAGIIADNALNGAYILIGLCFSALGVAAAFLVYCKKDIS